jgi:hypothetical protein
LSTTAGGGSATQQPLINADDMTGSVGFEDPLVGHGNSCVVVEVSHIGGEVHPTEHR